MPVTIKDNTRVALALVRTLDSKGIQEFCEEVVKFAKRDVHRITGNLSDSIDWEKIKVDMFVVFTTTGYGAFEELGTSKRGPHPFLAPAIQNAINSFKRKGRFPI